MIENLINPSAVFYGNERTWYTWTEICDNCDETIRECGFVSSSRKPDTVKAHFCVDCLRFMLDTRDV